MAIYWIFSSALSLIQFSMILSSVCTLKLWHVCFVDCKPIAKAATVVAVVIFANRTHQHHTWFNISQQNIHSLLFPSSAQSCHIHIHIRIRIQAFMYSYSVLCLLVLFQKNNEFSLFILLLWWKCTWIEKEILCVNKANLKCQIPMSKINCICHIRNLVFLSHYWQ